MAELRLRLERLPAGHPSSPYNDDGTRKTRVPSLRDLELPLPEEERPTVGSANPDRPGPSAAEPAVDRQRAADISLASESRTTTEPRTTADYQTPAVRGTTADSRPVADYRPAAEPKTTADGNSAADRNESAVSIGTSDPYRETKPDDPDNDKPQHHADGSWDWKGLHLTPEQSRIADNAISRCRAAEGRSVFGGYGDTGLTPTMRRVEGQLEHGRLVPETNEFVLKSPDRFKEKLAKLIADEPGASPAVMAAGIHDGVRYTFLIDKASYVHGVSDTRASLEKHGYELLTLRNAWDQDEYKGINSRWRDPGSGQLFEVQFHTNESWDAKQETHDAYEKIASLTTPVSERERLRARQREVSGSVRVPPGALEIPEYRKGQLSNNG